MLIVSELGEALEADRKDGHADYEAFHKEFEKRAAEVGKTRQEVLTQ